MGGVKFWTDRGEVALRDDLVENGCLRKLLAARIRQSYLILE